MKFDLFDPKQEVRIQAGNLPHWYQPGVTYFVTFRTDDSVPQSLLRGWHRRRDDWLQNNGINPHDESWKSQLRLNPVLEREYHKIFTRRFMEYLDRSYGKCVLRERRVADEVTKSLWHFHGERYVLGDFIVMPNHVHLLVCLLGATDIERQCRSWKRFAAGKINRLLSQRGRFWQEESFDHLVRSPEQFAHFQRYIADNPKKARLTDSEYLHYKLPNISEK